MVKRAILYIRVSSDEQAKGYSPASQEELLLRYCRLYNVEVVAIFKEDHSAKNFIRPEWKKLMEFLKKNKGKVEQILFINWSRFSRNTTEAYVTIDKLKKLGVEPQAIEQPLDFSIPEQKVMLANYLTIPEVENDRRALNVIDGLMRGKREGRITTAAPIGYINIRDEEKKAFIIPNPKYAPTIQMIFEMIAKGIYTLKEVYYHAKRYGQLKCGYNNFVLLVRNPIYCGRIYVPAYKGQEAFVRKGLHEPLVSEELFDMVQDVLNGKKKKHPVVNVCRREELPLRGFLVCPLCNRKMTGSASKGRNARYYYYHCQKPCNNRINAVEANEVFIKMLKSIRLRADWLDVYFDVLKDTFKQLSENFEREKAQINEELQRQETRLNRARQLLLDDDFDKIEYQKIKEDYAKIISNLRDQRLELEMKSNDYTEYLNWNKAFLKRIDKCYESAPLEKKQELIGSMFPKKIFFENNQYRTTKVNAVVGLITMNGNDLMGNKKGLERKSSFQPSKVGPIGQNSTQFTKDLQALRGIQKIKAYL